MAEANTQIEFTIVTLDKSSAKIKIGKAEKLGALLKIIADNYNPSATPYTLYVAGGGEIDISFTDMTLEQLYFENGLEILMTPLSQEDEDT